MPTTTLRRPGDGTEASGGIGGDAARLVDEQGAVHGLPDEGRAPGRDPEAPEHLAPGTVAGEYLIKSRRLK